MLQWSNGNKIASIQAWKRQQSISEGESLFTIFFLVIMQMATTPA